MHEQSGSYGSLESETSSLNSGEPDMNEKLTPVKWNILIRQLFARRNYIILILVPILLCPIPIVIGNQESKAGYGILIVVLYWVTEATHLAATAVLPIVLFPLLGILTAEEVSRVYADDANILFAGGLLVFVAFEQWNLHKRIALRVMLLVGTGQKRLLLGFMLTTGFLSMWLSNSATAAMMVKVAEAVLLALEKDDDRTEYNTDDNEEALPIPNSNGDLDPDTNFIQLKKYSSEEGLTNSEATLLVSDGDNFEVETPNSEERRKYLKGFSKALMISVAFSANIGGIATLTGTGPNMVFVGTNRQAFPKSSGISFASWFIFAFPLMVILLILSWIVIPLMFLQRRNSCCCRNGKNMRSNDDSVSYHVIKSQYDSLGPMTFAEKAVLAHFVILAILWISKEPQFIPGWGQLFKKRYVSDGTVAILVVFSLFQFPSERPTVVGMIKEQKVTQPPRPLLDTVIVSEKLTWSVLVLLGGSFAISAACKKSGLSHWMSCGLSVLSVLPDYAILIILCFIVVCVTEVVSNVGTTTIFLPIIASLAASLRIHPWYLMIPTTISSSFAFMFPISTPPNAIVYATGRLSMWDMVKAGIGMDIVCIGFLISAVQSYGIPYYGLRTFPDWAKSGPSSTGMICGSFISNSTFSSNLTLAAH